MARPRPRNLLVCFDAFGTLIAPRRPVPQQYGEVARRLGLSGFSDQDVKASFATAFKQMSREHPNYGRETSMGAETWWTNVIRKTFVPLASPQEVPEELAPLLLRRFSSGEGYGLVDEDAAALLRDLRRLRVWRPDGQNHRGPDRVVLGIITNSDDRIPGVLSSLGLSVGPLRWGRGTAPPASDPASSSSSSSSSAASPPRTQQPRHDVDFCCMSYDVGREKPDAAVFRAARALAAASVTDPDGGSQAAGPADEADWTSIYVGDDYGRDVVGALGAGWHGVLVKGGGGDETARWLPEFTASVSSVDELAARESEGFRAEGASTIMWWLCEQLRRE